MADVPDDAAPSDDPGAAPRPPPGTVIEGRYRLVDELGEGGVGWVYRAEHLKLGTQVAIKMLQAPYRQHEMLRPRFEREAQVLASLRHPNIVTLTDYSIAEDGHPYLVMELLEGQTLAELIERGPMDEARARRIVRQILDALIYAHGKGFAHRDLKPTNVFLVDLPTDADHVKILDFGFVKLLGGERGDAPALTRSGIAFGTPSYMCPEQATGGAIDPRADLYSVGVMFFEMLAGRRPYVGEIPDVIRQHLTEPVPSLDIGGAPIAAGLELRVLLERAMAKEPRDRFPNAQAMRDALDALPTQSVRTREKRVDAKAQTIPAPPPEPTQPERTRAATPATTAAVRGRRPRLKVFPILAGVVVAGCAAAIAWAVIEEHRGAERPTGDLAGAASVEPAGAERGATIDEPAGLADPRRADPRRADPRRADPRRADPSGATDPSGADPSGATDPSVTDPDAITAAGASFGEGSAEGPIVDDAPPGEGEGAPGVAIEAGDVGADPGLSATREDPWTSREPVPLLDEARRLLRTGEPLPRAEEQRMRSYVREHRDDPRAHLLLARHFLAREHTLSSVQRYALAYAVDPSARHDPTMLADLVKLARLPVASDQAADLLGRAYGDAALAPVEEALADPSLEPAERRRLEAVRDHLRSAP